ncbi:MAG: hypothetical protein QG614_606 [Patescibacteria group bacterium]|nr:hypothetical protein [Patescibacteria group bacterium]
MKRNTIIILVLILAALLVGAYFINKSSSNKTDNTLNESFKLLIKGLGNEPGWNVSVYGKNLTEESFNVDMVLDYGDTKWSGNLGKTWQENYDNEIQFRGDMLRTFDANQNATSPATSTASTKNVIVYFGKKTCMDDAGKTHDWSVSVNLNSEKEYKGCADMM